MPMNFGQAAFAAGFTVTRFIPAADIDGEGHGVFQPAASGISNFRGRYGVVSAGVKGAMKTPPEMLQHGQATWFIQSLLLNEPFLAANPQWWGVSFDPSNREHTADLSYVSGLYAYLKAEAIAHGVYDPAAEAAAIVPPTPNRPDGGTPPLPSPVAIPAAPLPLGVDPLARLVAAARDYVASLEPAEATTWEPLVDFLAGGGSSVALEQAVVKLALAKLDPAVGMALTPLLSTLLSGGRPTSTEALAALLPLLVQHLGS